jgi:hypothetical protein
MRTTEVSLGASLPAVASKANSGVELCEEGFNGSGRVPRPMRSWFASNSSCVILPWLAQMWVRSSVAVGEGCVVEVFDTVDSDDGNDLGAESFVNFVVGAKDGACFWCGGGLV